MAVQSTGGSGSSASSARKRKFAQASGSGTAATSSFPRKVVNARGTTSGLRQPGVLPYDKILGAHPEPQAGATMEYKGRRVPVPSMQENGVSNPLASLLKVGTKYVATKALEDEASAAARIARTASSASKGAPKSMLKDKPRVSAPKPKSPPPAPPEGAPAADVTKWKRAATAAEKAARTPNQVARDKAMAARQRASGVTRPTPGSNALLNAKPGTAEFRVQENAAKLEAKEAAKRRALGTNKPTDSLLEGPPGSKPRPGAKPNRRARVSATSAEQSGRSRVIARRPVRTKYKTQAAYDKALADFERTAAARKTTHLGGDTSAVPKRPANVADTNGRANSLMQNDIYAGRQGSLNKPAAAKPAAKTPRAPKPKAPAAKKPGTDVATSPKPTKPATPATKPSAPKPSKGSSDTGTSSKPKAPRKPRASKPAAGPRTDLAIRKSAMERMPAKAGSSSRREPIDIKATPIRRSDAIVPKGGTVARRPGSAVAKRTGTDVAVVGAGKASTSAAKGKWKKRAVAAGIAAGTVAAAVVSGKRQPDAQAGKQGPWGGYDKNKMPTVHGVDSHGIHVGNAEYARRWKYRNALKAMTPEQAAQAKKKEISRRKVWEAKFLKDHPKAAKARSTR